KNEPLARGGAYSPQFAHGGSRHPVVDHGPDSFSHRTFRDHAHASARGRQRGLHLFFPGHSGHADLRPFCLRLGLSHSCPPGFLRVYFLGQKGFCTYACPYGGFFGLADKLSPGKIRVTDACNQCGHCTVTCTSNVLVHAEVREYGMVVDPGCMKCMDCISVCPNDALYFGFGKPTVAVSKPKSKPIPRNYSLTWPEEIIGAFVFLGSFLAVRGVYALVPFLMALGCAAVTTFLALKTWRLLRTREVSFHRLTLKSSGTVQTAGWAFLAFSIFAVGLTAHCGWIRFHEYDGDRAFQKIQVPDELALAQIDPSLWLGPIDRDNILDGKKHLQAASDFGLFVNSEALPKLAWFEYLSGNAERSVELLDQASNHQKGQAKALSLYYRGTILNRLGRYEQ